MGGKTVNNLFIYLLFNYIFFFFLTLLLLLVVSIIVILVYIGILFQLILFTCPFYFFSPKLFGHYLLSWTLRNWAEQPLARKADKHINSHIWWHFKAVMKLCKQYTVIKSDACKKYLTAAGRCGDKLNKLSSSAVFGLHLSCLTEVAHFHCHMVLYHHNMLLKCYRC